MVGNVADLVLLLLVHHLLLDFRMMSLETSRSQRFWSSTCTRRIQRCLQFALRHVRRLVALNAERTITITMNWDGVRRSTGVSAAS